MIKLGERVKDMVTGFTGIAIKKTTYINGCIQFLVQPPVGDDNKMPEAEYFDHQRLELLEPAKDTRVYREPGQLLGLEVKDRISGFKGVVIAHVQEPSGRVRHGLRPRVDKDGKMPESEWFDEDELEVVSEGVKVPTSDSGADTHPDAPPMR